MQPKLNGKITIEQVLSEIRARPTTFWLCFVRATGKYRGTYKIVGKCRYGAPEQSGRHGVTPPPSERKKSLHVDRGTLPLTDHDTGEYITPLISHIVGYQGKLVIHHQHEQKKQRGNRRRRTNDDT